MNASLELLRANRLAFTKLLEHLSPERLTYIPEQFNNHILWNIGHVVVVSHLLTLQLFDVSSNLPKSMFQKFSPGSVPDRDVNMETIDEVKSQLLISIDPIERLYALRSSNPIVNPFKSALGFEITDVESALAFNNYHEGLHMGIIQKLRKLSKVIG